MGDFCRRVFFFFFFFFCLLILLKVISRKFLDSIQFSFRLAAQSAVKFISTIITYSPKMHRNVCLIPSLGVQYMELERNLFWPLPH